MDVGEGELRCCGSGVQLRPRVAGELGVAVIEVITAGCLRVRTGKESRVGCELAGILQWC